MTWTNNLSEDDLEFSNNVGVNLVTDAELDKLDPSISKGFATEFVPAPRRLFGIINNWRNMDIANILQKLVSQITPTDHLFRTIWDVDLRISEMSPTNSPSWIFKQYWTVPSAFGIEGIKIYKAGLRGGEVFKFAILTDGGGDMRAYSGYHSSILKKYLQLLTPIERLIIQSAAEN